MRSTCLAHAGNALLNTARGIAAAAGPVLLFLLPVNPVTLLVLTILEVVHLIASLFRGSGTTGHYVGCSAYGSSPGGSGGVVGCGLELVPCRGPARGRRFMSVTAASSAA